MRKFLHQKKFLLLALYEDLLLIVFFFTLLASSIEMVLPGILANRLPLAFLFTFLVLLFFFYVTWRQKEGLPSLQWSLPPSLSITLFILLFLVTLFVARNFGFLGATFQALLLVMALYYWHYRK